MSVQSWTGEVVIARIIVSVDTDYCQSGSRFIEGYGLHKSSIDDAKEKGIGLLITVDCGITNNEAALYAKEEGIDLIITDHHILGKKLPNATAVINPYVNV